MSTQITVAVAPTSLMPEIPGCGSTQVTVTDDEVTPLELLVEQRTQTARLIGTSAAPAPGGWPAEGGPGSAGLVGGWPPIPPGSESPWYRTSIGQATYRALLADSRFQVAVVS
jgi:hypothetical protein